MSFLRDLVEIDDYYIDPKTYIAEWENTPRCLSAALAYAAMGWRIFSAPRGEKKSHKSAKFSDGRKWGATSDADEIRSNYARWPEANVGITTGIENGFFVIDADTVKGHGVDGIASLRTLEADHGALPPTLASQSPTGSIHLFFKHPGGVKIGNTDSELAAGVDIRGDGGMVIAPPSVKAGIGSYVWINNLPIADPPEWLLELVRKKERENNHEVTPDGKWNADASEIAAALTVIPASINYHAWFEICCALRHELGDAGFKMFDGWSSRSKEKYDERECPKKWDEAKKFTAYTAGTIFHHANEADPTWRYRHDNEIEAKIGTANARATSGDDPMLAELTAQAGERPAEPPNDPASEPPKPEEPRPEQPEPEQPKPTAASAQFFAQAAAAREQQSEQPQTPAEPAVQPFDFWSKFNPPPLPRGLLPRVIEEFAFEKSRLMGADPGGLAMAALAACAAAIPDKVKLKVRRHDSWLESTRLWVGVIGGPGEKKSPTIFQVMKHLKRRDYEMWRKYAREKKEWEGLPKEERQGRNPPRQERLVVEDITMEAMQEVMRDSPNGLLCHRDELSGWFGSMDKYGGRGGAAADRGFWLQAYDGGSYGYNRIGRGSHMIENLSASLLGGIQPEPMRAIADTMVDDGLIQRIIPIVMSPAAKAIDAPISDAELRYEHMIEHLFKIEEPFDGYIIFDDAAAEVRDRLEQKHLDLTQFRVFSKKLRSHIAKYDKTFARLCLLWHCIENAPRELGMVSETTAVRVADFLHKFLLPHAMTFYNDVYGLADDYDELEELVNYILAHGLTVVTGRAVHHGSGRMRGLKARQVEELFQQLEALGWVKRLQGRRVDSVQWQVNPEVHRLFRARAEQEAERCRHDRQMLQDIFAQGRSV